MAELKTKIPAKWHSKLKVQKQPQWVSPMLATLTEDYFSSKEWIYERKWDGERCIAMKKGEDVHLFSRNHKSLNVTYPEIVEALKKQRASDFVVDGEIVALDGKKSSFSRLQQRMQIKNEKEARKSKLKVYYNLFDLLFFDGFNLEGLSLRIRKKILLGEIEFDEVIHFTQHRNEHGEKYFQIACNKGWEGLIAKDSQAPYDHKRSSKWLKFKCVHQQEFVIGGYTDPHGERLGFGALLIGYYQDEKLQFAGKVGTGYDDDFLRSFSKKMQKISVKDNPFNEETGEKNVHFIKPRLIAEIGFTEWTDDNKLRHPRFLGLRDDKSPKKVVREQ